MAFNNFALTHLGNIYEGGCKILEEGSPVDPFPMLNATMAWLQNKNTLIVEFNVKYTYY